MILHLLFHVKTEELIIVTETSYTVAFRTDPDWIDIGFIQQCSPNGITLARILETFAKYIDAGIQLDFLADATTAIINRSE